MSSYLDLLLGKTNSNANDFRNSRGNRSINPHEPAVISTNKLRYIVMFGLDTARVVIS